MSQSVWTLSVDLQTKTAVFQSGMADAARAARGSFNDIKQGAGQMAKETSASMTDTREGVMLLGEEFGIHLPRALTTFVAELGPIGAAMETAFPFLALIALATIFVEHLAKMREEGEKLTAAQANFGVVTANVLNQLDDKLLQAGISSDELSGNHLAALEKQLELIDHQSLKELEQSFQELDKAADAVMTQLKAHWYEFGSGSTGAQHALEDFKQKYDLLLAQGKDKDASDLLAGTLQSAQRILDLQKQAKDNQTVSSGQGTKYGDYFKYEAAITELKKTGVGITQKEIEAQQTLVDSLRAQADAEQKVHDLKSLQDANARGTTAKQIGADEDKVARAQASEAQRAQDEQDKLDEQRYQEAVAAIQQNEKEKITATEQGSQARLNAIDAAIKDENAKGLQETGFYKELLTQRVDTQRQFNEEARREDAESKMEEAQQALKMGELKVAADREAAALRLSAKHNSDAARLESDIDLENEDFKVKQQAFNAELAALDSHGKDYENKLKALQNREAEMVQEHEDKITAIKDKAEMARNSRILQAERQFDDALARGLTSTLTRHQSFASMMNSLASEVANGLISNALKAILADDMTKPHDAAKAARKAFLAGEETIPGWPGVILGGALAAGAFASVMAFAEGGLVPGVERGDIVPARLSPGEAVLPKKMTERLNRASDDGVHGGQAVHYHAHYRPEVHAVDRDGVREMLEKHADEFHRSFNNHIRKMNR